MDSNSNSNAAASALNNNNNNNDNMNNGGGVSSKSKTNDGGERKGGGAGIKGEMVGKTIIGIICGTLVYYHCAYRNSTFLSLLSDVFIVLLCSLAILGLLFRQINIQ